MFLKRLNKYFNKEFLKKLFFLGIILLASFCLLNLQNKSTLLIIIFVYFFIFLFFQLFKLITKNSQDKEVWVIVLIELLIIFFFFSRINNLELWGDEIAVLDIASEPFEDISLAVANYHASVPPFDYWMMHFWFKLVDKLDIFYQEIFFRVPYLFFHMLGSVFFFLILKHDTKTFTMTDTAFFKKILLIVAALGYFIQPLLFLYAIEVRFYSLAVLGVVVTLYLFLTKQLHKGSSIIISGIFCLNSIFQFIIIFPLLFAGLIDKSLRKASAVGIIFHLLLLRIIWPRLNMYDQVSILKSDSLLLIKSSFQGFLEQLFVNPLQWLLFLVVLVFYVIKVKQTKYFFLFVVAGISLFTIAFSAYQKAYFDFHLRHFIFTVPIILFLLFSFPVKFFSRFPLFISAVFFVICIVPWGVHTYRYIDTQQLFSKSLVEAKKIAMQAKQANKDLLIFPASDSSVPYLEGVYSFHTRTIAWYAKRYSLTLFNENLQQVTCDEVFSKRSLLVIRFWDPIPCLESEPKYFNSSIVYEL